MVLGGEIIYICYLELICEEDLFIYSLPFSQSFISVWAYIYLYEKAIYYFVA